jgi:predicted transcriptional regulator
MAFGRLAQRDPPRPMRPTPPQFQVYRLQRARSQAVYHALAAPAPASHVRSRGRNGEHEGIGKRSIMAVSNYRHKKILEMVYQRKSVSADELAAEFGVSKITIRRDLDTLAMDKLLERTRGGAISISPTWASRRSSKPRTTPPRRRSR